MYLNNLYKKVFLALASLSWVVLTVVTVSIAPTYFETGIAEVISEYYAIEFFLVLFIGSSLLYFKISIESIKEEGFSKLLLQLFIRGAIMVSVLSIIWISFELLSDMPELNLVAINILNSLSLITVVMFMSMAFYVFKKMITYQKTRIVFKLWNLFELAIFLSLPLVFVHFTFFDRVFQAILALFFIFGLVLSVNQNWIVYFTFKQKWNSILLTSLILIISLLFTGFVYSNSVDYGSMSINNHQVVDIIHDVPIVSLFVFIITYCIFSILVILFNLPISSAFERKFKETANFQQLSHIIQTGDNEEKIYPVLLETSVNIVMAQSAWLDIYEEKDVPSNTLTQNIDNADIRYLKVLIEKRLNITLASVLNLDKIQDERVKSFVSGKPYKSLLYIPLAYGYEIIGELVLIRDLNNAFDKQLINSVKTYVDQAVSRIINSRLLKEAIENQRYQEEKKIAAEVKKQLINEELLEVTDFEIAASSRSYSDVGGDYFDFAKTEENEYLLAIADVSGSGITAAFNMAQLKGVFKALILNSKTPKELVLKANKALSNTLSKTSFVTLSLFQIDMETNTLAYVRAGHCPAILYNAKDKSTTLLSEKGLGLGILRSDDYESYITEGIVNFEKGDILTLFTDGIIECRNEDNDEFGYDNLSNIIKEKHTENPESIQEAIFKGVLKFQGHDMLKDDLSCVIVKF